MRLKRSITVVLIPFLIASTLSCPAAASPPSSTHIIQEPARIVGGLMRPAVVGVPSCRPMFTIPDERVVMGFRGKSILYLPRSIKSVVIQPRTYTLDKFSEEISDHYTYSYLAGALIYVTLALLVRAKEGR